MANTWANAVMTNKGLALQAKLLAGTTLTITKAMTGSGTVATASLPSQTAVSSPQQTLSARTVSYSGGAAAVPFYLGNDSLATGYTAMQVGVYAQDPDEGEILYFIAQAATGGGTYVPSNTEMPGFSAEWTFYFAIGQADEVEVTVDPAHSVSQEEAQQMIDTSIGAATIAVSQISGVLPTANGGTGNANGTVAKLTTARTIRTNLGSTSTASFDGSANVTPGVTGTLPIANGGTGNTTGLAASATKLATARTIRTNLGSTSTASFDGSANVTPGVTGTLPIANGGTGRTDGNIAGNAGTATKLATARTIRTNLASTSTASFDGSANVTPGVTGILPVAHGGTGNEYGAASELLITRSFRVNLASTSTAGFNGSADCTPGVTGVLKVANGGTGNSSVDTTPTSGSTKMVTSGGVYTAINTASNSKQNTILKGTSAPSSSTGSNGDVYIQY